MREEEEEGEKKALLLRAPLVAIGAQKMLISITNISMLDKFQYKKIHKVSLGRFDFPLPISVS